MAWYRAAIFPTVPGYRLTEASMAAAFCFGCVVFSAAMYALYSAGSLIVFWLAGGFCCPKSWVELNKPRLGPIKTKTRNKVGSFGQVWRILVISGLARSIAKGFGLE